ncbi:MAG: hypothetical protein JEZ11_04685 [Desulfobacterales bacterium]|nr:hypothetical protein [Desulfobacterales bacterium]
MMKKMMMSVTTMVFVLFLSGLMAGAWAGGQNVCYSGKKCSGKVLNSKLQHAHQCKGKSFEIKDGSCGGTSKNGCYTVKAAMKCQGSKKSKK